MPAPKLVTAQEAADYLGISVRTIRQWVDDERIPFYRFGVIRFSIAELDAWLEKHKIEARA